MSIIQEPHVACKGQTTPEEYRRWVFSHMPAVGSLLDKLDAGGELNFLDVMAGISEIVAFYTEGDSLESEESVRFSVMSGKYCRFCC